MDRIESLLRERFAHSGFLPGQEAVIRQLCAGQSTAAVFPTGGGKSLCYQLPALLFDGLTVVVSPLIALMKDQIDALARRGIAASRLDSSLGPDELRSVMTAVRSGRQRLLYVAPERFNNERFREALAGVDIALFAVDEAHCISEWGHNFRPDYLKLVEYARAYRAERVLALTATATARVLSDICKELGIRAEHAVRTPFHRPNLTLLTTAVDAAARDTALLERLRGRPPGGTIVYVTLQRTAERVAELLSVAGLAAEPYHAGMTDERRAEVQERFMAAKDRIVVATIAFGMGIDKADIRYVYHYNLPKSLESYSQEVGRAGRDGGPATCELMACADDLGALENFAYGDTPSPEAVRALVQGVFSLATPGEVFAVAEPELTVEHDIRPLVVRTLLTYLELDGYLEGGTPFYQGYRFKPLLPSAEILPRFEGERGRQLTAIFRSVTKKRVWFEVDVNAAADVIGQPRQAVVALLDELHDRGMIELEASAMRRRYKLLREPEDIDAVADELVRRVQRREKTELDRVSEVVAWVSHDGCQTSRLGAHFDDPPRPTPCGRCSFCLTGPTVVPPRIEAPLDPRILERAAELRAEQPAVLADPRAAARFLCGLPSPRISRARLGSHALFGAFASSPFPRVLAAMAGAPPSRDDGR